MLSVSAVRDSATTSNPKTWEQDHDVEHYRRFIDEIFRELLAYLEYFDEFCIKVVHTMVLNLMF